jgi:DMSO/TMAO reductase YedYZ molybdopterin-dependent catalytic subunit
MTPTRKEPALLARTQTSAAASFFRERPAQPVELSSSLVHRSTRRDVLLFGAGVATTLVATGSLLPPATLARLGLASASKDRAKREWLLNNALRLDDDIAEALYSRGRMVPTYDKARITPLKNNYNGATPDPGYIPEWKLILDGLSSGVTISLSIRNLLANFGVHDQVTRLVCVEGWSAIAWWSGIRFDDLVHTYPPVSQAKWARVESSVNLDSAGIRDPYFVSIDLATACHTQTLLATHLNGQPLTVEHGAPLRLLAPMKLGLKNVKAITRISYVAEEPTDYWAKRGYSSYDGI